MKWWQRLLHGWLRRRRGGLDAYPVMMTDFQTDLPDHPAPATIYLIGEGRNLWVAALVCPCGCGELLQMSLMPHGRPRWKATQHWDGTVSLHPSVWRQKGCRSHFFLRRGRVLWCRT